MASLQAIVEKNGAIVLFWCFCDCSFWRLCGGVFGALVVVFLVFLWWCFCGGVCCGRVLDM